MKQLPKWTVEGCDIEEKCGVWGKATAIASDLDHVEKEPPRVLKFVTSTLFLREHTAKSSLSKGTIISRTEVYPKRSQNISYLDGCHPVSRKFCAFL
jgi:hypothetical protein